MRKILALLLALLLLCGCAATPPVESQPENTKLDETESTTAAETETTKGQYEDPYYEEPDVTLYTVPDYPPSVIPVELPTKEDPIHFIDFNMDIDFYQNSNLVNFDIKFISDHEIQYSDLELDIPADTPYRYSFSEWFRFQPPSSLQTMPEDGIAVPFSYDIYLCYCDFDWRELGIKYQKIQDVLNDTQYEGKPVAKQQALQKAENEYWEYYRALWGEYIQLDETMIPYFYPYVITVTLSTPLIEKEEKFNSVDVTINGETTTVDIGEIRLHPQQATVTTKGYGEYIGKTTAGGYSPVTETSNSYVVYLDFEAKEDLILTGFDFRYSEVEHGDLTVTFSGSEGAADFVWDGKMPINIPKGSDVLVQTTITDERLTDHGFSFHLWPCLEFEADGQTFQYGYNLWLYDDINFQEEYADYYHGIDVRAYYDDYLFPYVLGITREE